MQRKYYEAYEDRYRQIHGQALQWFSENSSAIVEETLKSFSLPLQCKLLEIGCGEGRDAYPLLKQGYDLLATDVSREAIAFCKTKYPDFSDHFQVVDCVTETLDQQFDFIYAVAVIHMLVSDEDRNAFYRFIRTHLNSDGIALIGTMGDGRLERQSDIHIAFDLQDRVHEQTGKPVKIAATSCRIVNWVTFGEELKRNGLDVMQQGITAVLPDFPQMMFAVVKKH